MTEREGGKETAELGDGAGAGAGRWLMADGPGPPLELWRSARSGNVEVCPQA